MAKDNRSKRYNLAPRTPEDAAFLAKFNSRMRLPIVLAALLPLIVVPQPGKEIGVIVGIASWLVFVLDFVVHMRRQNSYFGTGIGKFDLAIVVFTSPWYLIPGANSGGIVVVLRLARLARVIVVAHGARRLLERLGRVAVIALTIVLVASIVAYHAENPSNPEYATLWDSLWWGYVTLTTVGYGDIVPVTDTGRWAGVVIMTTGIAVLGMLSGSLASFFRLTPKQVQEDDKRDEADRAAAGGPAQAPLADSGDIPDAPDELRQVVIELRDEIKELSAHVIALSDRRAPPQQGGASQPTD